MGILDRLKSAFNPKTDVDNNRFYDQWGVKYVWERKELPSPGAMNYAFETLALAPESEISGAVAQRQQLSLITSGQLYKYQDVVLQGVPLVSGQILGQALYDPAVGYTNLPSDNSYSDLVAGNIVADRMGPRGMNAPHIGNT